MTSKTLFLALSALSSQSRAMSAKPPSSPFPLPTIYPQQEICLEQMKGELSCSKQLALTSHTGAGKTAVFRALAYSAPTIIIEPRKFLQKQAAAYCNDFILYGRSEYPCHYAPSAASAPCNRKSECTPEFNKTCKDRTKNCDSKKCRVFPNKGKFVKFPCQPCKYLSAQAEAQRVLKSGGVVICNFGNFWQLLKHAKLVVIDEAVLFFREISKPTKMLYSSPKQHSDNSIAELLHREHDGLSRALKSSPASETYRIQNALYTIQFLESYAELCFKYQRKDRIFVEVSPSNVSILKDKLFKDKQVIIVSATLGDFDIPSFSYSIWQRRGIFYAPVGKMTSRELQAKPFMMDRAAEAIETTSAIAEGMFDTHKFPVHCGNLTTHAPRLMELLGEDCCTIHTKGNLMSTIDKFVNNDTRYLLIAGADYGGDFTWAKIQFILKFPYANLDERMRTLERTMGKEMFNEYYVGEAISRVVQQCGRVCRGFGDFGTSIILDAKFMEVYRMNKDRFPVWFRDSFDEKTY